MNEFEENPYKLLKHPETLLINSDSKSYSITVITQEKKPIKKLYQIT